MTNWGIAFFAALTRGAVAVPILNDFKPENVHALVNHSEARLLFAGCAVWKNLDAAEMPGLEGVISLEDFSVVRGGEALRSARARLNELFGRKYPDRFLPSSVSYRRDKLDELAIINYTSGTTTAPKGVMLPYRSLWSNLLFAFGVFGEMPVERVISMLPMAHMYGMMFEFIYEFASGAQVFFLTRTPSPQVIAESFARIKPNLIISVPLIIEKIIRKRVFPVVERPWMKVLLRLPLIKSRVRAAICRQVVQAFGGNFNEVIVGGAALNKEVEDFLHAIRFPCTVGYGMTESGPILAYDGWATSKSGSCGKSTPRMELKIDSSDPTREVGEILARGDNLMMGYYKNEEATRAAFTDDGWMRTGDLGLIDEDGYLFIKGRCKNMILGPNGQNIYPEEIEDRLNALPYVSESIVKEIDRKLVALVCPDKEALEADGKSEADAKKVMEENRQQLNHSLPAYSQVTRVVVQLDEFEKTPKRSIKRYLY